MSCTHYGNVIVCQPTRGGAVQRQNGKCIGACETETSRLVMFERSPWYGPDWHCLDCGDSWSCEGLFQRPFRRAWRKGAITRHEQMWESACWCEVSYDSEHYALPCQNHAPAPVGEENSHE